VTVDYIVLVSTVNTKPDKDGTSAMALRFREFLIELRAERVAA
jgi:hypothetical protein